MIQLVLCLVRLPVGLSAFGSRWEGLALCDSPFLPSITASRPLYRVLAGGFGGFSRFVLLFHLESTFLAPPKLSYIQYSKFDLIRQRGRLFSGYGPNPNVNSAFA